MLRLKKIALLLLSSTFVARASYANPVNALLHVPSPGLHLVKRATLIKAVAPETPMDFTVWLELRNKRELEQLAQYVYDSNSSRYHQFLTSERYEREFAPSKDTEELVQQFFAAQGMRAKVVNHSVRVSGTVAQIERTLHVRMNYYQFQNKRVYANANTPKLNAELVPYISEITGLSSIPEFQSNSDSANGNDKAVHDLTFFWHDFIPSALPTDRSLQGFSGANLQKAYNLDNIPPINGKQLNGAGQTLVIVDVCGSNGPAEILRDANKYFNANGIAPFIPSGPSKNFTVINPDGSPFTTCPGSPSFSREIALDVESSHTLAPGDNTVLVLGTNSQRTALIDVISTLVQNNYTIGGFSNAYVISNSWSSPETSLDPALENALISAAASGISVNFSSGDCGDNTYTTTGKCTGTGSSSLAVNYPSSSIYVTAVGATALFVDNKYRYAFETVWGTVKNSAYDGGTGGGVSQFNAPAGWNWQSSISTFTAGGYGVINSPANGGRRALPDIAMLGDPKTGLLIIAGGVEVKDGGTSLACPLFSATLLLVNQARYLLNKGTPIGHAAPYLYRHNSELLTSKALHLIIPPAQIISGAAPPPGIPIQGTSAPASAFTIGDTTYGWDSSLTVEPENQFWNDGTGVGSPNIPNFVLAMAHL